MKRLLLATVTMAVVSGTAYGMPGPEFPGMGGPGFGPGEGILRALLRLDLTDSQKHEAALILAKQRMEGQKKMEAVRKAMEELREAAEADALDEEAVRNAFKGAAAAGEELAVHGARLRAELRGILTPEQKAALEEFKADRHERHKARRERGVSFLDEWIEMHSKVEGSQ